jgi:hypothetical protein
MAEYCCDLETPGTLDIDEKTVGTWNTALELMHSGLDLGAAIQ